MSYEDMADELENGNETQTETADAQADRAFRQSPPAYKIIRGTDIADLADAVNQNIEKGYRPLGGPAYCPPGMQEMATMPHPFWQAMVKDEMIF